MDTWKRESPSIYEPMPFPKSVADEDSRLGMESHIGKLTGHAAAAQGTYRRYCVGCHGVLGDGEGENAQWIDPKPRNFTLGIFKCRSTTTGTLPLDSDIYASIGRGLDSSNMPSWNPLSPATPVLPQALSRAISCNGRHWIASMSVMRTAIGCKCSVWTGSQEASALEWEARLKLAELYFQSMGAAGPRDLQKLFGWSPEITARVLRRMQEAGTIRGGFCRYRFRRYFDREDLPARYRGW